MFTCNTFSRSRAGLVVRVFRCSNQCLQWSLCMMDMMFFKSSPRAPVRNPRLNCRFFQDGFSRSRICPSKIFLPAFSDQGPDLFNIPKKFVLHFKETFTRYFCGDTDFLCILLLTVRFSILSTSCSWPFSHFSVPPPSSVSPTWRSCLT